ncbi:MAG TPA: endonuclease/exonuclease/phosphatase family protein [Gaiellaceae bacterium]|nr:endonuclease/exonuclease/phosphatase family protein [Gaiellaceae bacterium]
MLIRTWNLFHGNTLPPQRASFLDEMITLATADDPDVVCVQEVPAWALGRFTIGDVAQPPTVGPFPSSASLGRRLTSLHPGLLRSAFSGQGNAIAVAPRLRVLSHERETLNPRGFRSSEARRLGLGVVGRNAWAKERRIVQTVRLGADDGRTYLVANTHCTSLPDRRIAQAELLRAAAFATSTALPGDVVVLAGDFNLTAAAAVMQELTGPDWGFSAAGPGIDHVLVRGAETTAARRWSTERRRVDGHLLSDHAPVEVEIS